MKDFEKASADGELSNSEIIAFIMDFAFLVMDTVSVLSLPKNIAKGVKAAKLASTAASAAKKEASKEAANSMAKDTGKNVVDKYLPTEGNHNVPNKVLEDTKDTLLDEGA